MTNVNKIKIFILKQHFNKKNSSAHHLACFVNNIPEFLHFLNAECVKFYGDSEFQRSSFMDFVKHISCSLKLGLARLGSES